MAEITIRPKVLALSFLLITLVWDIIGYIWHGLLGQPSLLNLLYEGFWTNPTLLFYGLIVSLVAAYACGYVFALIFNWTGKKIK